MEPTAQTTSVIYGGFRKRVLVALVDLGFGIFVVPTQTVWAVVGVVLFVGSIILNVLVRLIGVK